MAILMNFANEYNTTEALENVVNYILNSKHLYEYCGYGTMLSNTDAIINNFLMVQKAFCKDDGVRIHHLALAFEKDSVYRSDLYYIARYISNYIGKDFQNIFGVHTESDMNNEHFHIHIAINPVSYIDGHKFSYKYSYFAPLLKQLEEEYEIHIIIR